MSKALYTDYDFLAAQVSLREELRLAKQRGKRLFLWGVVVGLAWANIAFFIFFKVAPR